MGLSIVILAAGKGKRMHSDLPKVLHPVGGKPLLEHVIDTAEALGADAIHVVYGHGGEQVRERLGYRRVQWVEQARQLGTGHAVAQALPQVPNNDRVLVLYGDVPLISAATLTKLLAAGEESSLGLLTAHLRRPQGYGRILRNEAGQVEGIVEEKDATDAQRSITEVNTGFLTALAEPLKSWVALLDNANAQGEYYLTDVIALAVRQGGLVRTVAAESKAEILGVNDRAQQAELERYYQRDRAAAVMAAGVTLLDPARFDLRGTLRAGRDVSIDVNAVLEGDIELGDRVSIGPNAVLRNARIGADTQVFAHCVIEDAEIGTGARIGPFARIRPEARLADDVHVGNFVEIKKSEVGRGSKINHLSYIGDTTIGKGVNVGAGTITCNYDGASKHRTVIEDEAFIGSDTQLVAPVTVGAGATIGAGSTITRDAPAGELTLSRTPQQTREGWKRPTKNKS